MVRAGSRECRPFAWATRSALILTASTLLAGSVALAGPHALASGAGSLTCFAVDVSGSNVSVFGGQPPSDPGPLFVRQQVVKLYDEVLAQKRGPAR